jgi:hypothetical protein
MQALVGAKTRYYVVPSRRIGQSVAVAPGDRDKLATTPPVDSFAEVDVAAPLRGACQFCEYWTFNIILGTFSRLVGTAMALVARAKAVRSVEMERMWRCKLFR